MAANPMASRSAALAGAAQALNKPKPPGGRQDLSGASGGTIRGAHGGTQQLGEAAKRRLGGQQDPNQSPPIVAPGVGGGMKPDEQKPGGVGFTKPMQLPGFMSALPKPDPGMQIFGDGAKLPPEVANMTGGPGGLPPMPPEVAQMLSERMGAGEMMGGAPGMSAGDTTDMPFGGRLGGKMPYGQTTSTGGGVLPGFQPTLNGPPMQTKPAFNPNGGMQAEGPMGAMPGPRPKPGMPTKPLETDPPAPAPGGVWGQIAGGGGLRPRNNMASY